MDVPKGMALRITFIYPTQDEAVKVWEELVQDWYMFMWEWIYNKGVMTYVIWYDDEIHKMLSTAEVYELPKGTKKTKKILEKSLLEKNKVA